VSSAAASGESNSGLDLLVSVAADVAGDQAEFADATLDRLRLATPELIANSALEQALRLSSTANLSRVHQILAVPTSHSIPVSLPAEAHELTVALVRHGVPLVALLEAWRVGQTFVSDWWRHRIEERASERSSLTSAVDAAQLRISNFADSAIAEIRTTYELQRRAWEGTLPSRRMRMVHALLGEQPVDQARASGILNYPLDTFHTAGVVWQSSELSIEPSIENTSLESAVNLAAARLGGTSFLNVPVSATTAWIWSSGPVDVASAAKLPRGLHLALGSCLKGVAGFRRSHFEALEAQRVARMGDGTSVSVIDYADVEIAAMMSRDAVDMWSFVHRTLGPLANDGQATAQLRETLAAYIECGLSAAETARLLRTHRNTIHYRMSRICDLIGDDFTPRLTELAVALKLVSSFGSIPSPAAVGLPALGRTLAR
jgi:hypothetical protein